MPELSPPPGPPAPQDPESIPHAVPHGALMVVAVLLLALAFMWMLALGVLQGRA